MTANKRRCPVEQKPEVIIAVFLYALLAQGSPYVMNSAGTRIDGAAIRSAPDGTITLTTRNGQELMFAPGTYQKAAADQPSGIAKAAEQARSGNFAEAAQMLRRVKEEYRFLGWDLRASLMLARVQLAARNFAAAASEYEELFAIHPQLKTTPVERANYMQALRGAGRSNETAALIDEDIASGSREAAARAQIVRGDMKTAAGQVEEALLDYLRTVILFKDQAGVQPEAAYKTACALRQLNDPRAAEYFKTVIREFPESEFAEQARREVQ